MLVKNFQHFSLFCPALSPDIVERGASKEPSYSDVQPLYTLSTCLSVGLEHQLTRRNNRFYVPGAEQRGQGYEICVQYMYLLIITHEINGKDKALLGH